MQNVLSLVPLLLGNGPEDESGQPIFWILLIMLSVVIILGRIIDIIRHIRNYA